MAISPSRLQVGGGLLLLGGDVVWAEAGLRVALVPEPLVDGQGSVYGEVLHVRLQDVYDVHLAGDLHQLRAATQNCTAITADHWPCSAPHERKVSNRCTKDQRHVLAGTDVPSYACWCSNSHPPACSSAPRGSRCWYSDPHSPFWSYPPGPPSGWQKGIGHLSHYVLPWSASPLVKRVLIASCDIWTLHKLIRLS